MEPTLILALEGLGLDQSCHPRLASLGVGQMGDLKFLCEEDFMTAGFNTVEMRKMQSLVADPQQLHSAVPGHVQSLKNSLQTQDCLPMVHTEISEEVSDESDSSGGEDFQMPSSSASPFSPFSPFSPRLSADGSHITVCPYDSGSFPRSRRRPTAFWQTQMKGRPLRVVFIRHGESEGNVERDITASVPDHLLHLTEAGRGQALDAGRRLRSIVQDESVRFTVSPYMRTRETLNGILQAWEQHEHLPNWIREDVRIREQEYGNYDSPDMKRLHALKKQFGPFYFRFPEGESIADCFDRASLFLESMYRTWSDNVSKNHVVVGHGVMILVTLMRLLRLPVEEFDNLDRLSNCEFVVLERPENEAKYHIAYTWQSEREPDREGLRRIAGASEVIRPQTWSGNPAEPLLRSR